METYKGFKRWYYGLFPATPLGRNVASWISHVAVFAVAMLFFWGSLALVGVGHPKLTGYLMAAAFYVLREIEQRLAKDHTSLDNVMDVVSPLALNLLWFL